MLEEQANFFVGASVNFAEQANIIGPLNPFRFFLRRIDFLYPLP